MKLSRPLFAFLMPPSIFGFLDGLCLCLQSPDFRNGSSVEDGVLRSRSRLGTTAAREKTDTAGFDPLRPLTLGPPSNTPGVEGLLKMAGFCRGFCPRSRAGTISALSFPARVSALRPNGRRR